MLRARAAIRAYWPAAEGLRRDDFMAADYFARGRARHTALMTAYACLYVEGLGSTR